MYACFGNGFDTWEVDLLYGGAHKKGAAAVENITTFKIRQNKKKWFIDIRHANGKKSSRPVKTYSQNSRSSYLKEIAYREAQVLALAELKQLKKMK